MTIVQLISSEGFFGAESMMVTLAEAVARQGHRSVVALFQDRRHTHVETGEPACRRGIPVELVPCRGRWDWSTVRSLRRLLDRHSADVLHSHGYKADVYGYAAVWPCRAAVVATCHNWPDRRPSMRAYAALDRLILRRFDGVAAASGPVAGVLRRWGVSAPTLPNGVDMERFRQAPASRRDWPPPGCDRLVGFVGRLVAAKGGAVLLAAARHVIAARPGTAFLFVGEGPCRREWETLAARLGIARHVLFDGTRDDMPQVYASLDLLVLPSFDEAMPMCLLEAMAAGRPVVATRVGEVPRAVLPGVTGLLIDPGDQKGLALAMLQVLGDESLARSLATRGREHVARSFSSEAMAAAYIDLYEHALSRFVRQRKCSLAPS